MQEFWINIAAGAILSTVTWLLVRVLLPYYRAWRFEAPELRGDWSFFDTDAPDSKPVGSAQITQKGELISARVTRTQSRKGKAISRSFQYTGRVRSGQLLLSFEEPTTGGLISGCLVLSVSGDCRGLAGYTVYLDRDCGRVVAHPIYFKWL